MGAWRGAASSWGLGSKGIRVLFQDLGRDVSKPIISVSPLKGRPQPWGKVL